MDNTGAGSTQEILESDYSGGDGPVDAAILASILKQSEILSATSNPRLRQIWNQVTVDYNQQLGPRQSQKTVKQLQQFHFDMGGVVRHGLRGPGRPKIGVEEAAAVEQRAAAEGGSVRRKSIREDDLNGSSPVNTVVLKNLLEESKIFETESSQEVATKWKQITAAYNHEVGLSGHKTCKQLQDFVAYKQQLARKKLQNEQKFGNDVTRNHVNPTNERKAKVSDGPIRKQSRMSEMEAGGPIRTTMGRGGSFEPIRKEKQSMDGPIKTEILIKAPSSKYDYEAWRKYYDALAAKQEYDTKLLEVEKASILAKLELEGLSKQLGVPVPK